MESDPLLLAAVAVWCFTVALVGGAVGLVFGNIRLPAIVAVASGPAAGAGANVGISGIAATAAAIVHIRAGRIDWRVFAWMAPPSMVGAVAGGYASGLLPDTVLLIFSSGQIGFLDAVNLEIISKEVVATLVGSIGLTVLLWFVGYLVVGGIR